HASIIPAYRQEGDGDVMAGFRKVCGMTIQDAWKLADHHVSCIDCHDPRTMQLRVDRPAFLDGIRALARGKSAVPQLPSIERWLGIHARRGVSGADSHMPYVREGAVKVSDHQVRSPRQNINRACQTCHRYPEKELEARIDLIHDRHKELMKRAEAAVMSLMDAV